ncbi:MAG: hypothetical protein KC416_14015, partial [Myxococcales bacterium]|nr:hypothetical protein [Myxococcales bacterium]
CPKTQGVCQSIRPASSGLLVVWVSGEMEVHDTFRRSVSEAALVAQNGRREVVFGLLPDLRLGYFNDAWVAFAAKNGGDEITRRWPVGRSILSATPEILRLYFAERYGRVVSTGRPWQTAYDCSSPTVYRRFRMEVNRVEGGCLFAVNHLEEERSLDPRTAGAVEDAASQPWQCVNCRRVSSSRIGSDWRWIPARVAHPARVSRETICPDCLGNYPELDPPR